MATPTKREIARWFGAWDGDDDQEKILAELDDAVIVYAAYETGAYEGDWCVIFVKNGEWYDESGSHCSCNGPEWSPTKKSLAEVLNAHDDRDWGSHSKAHAAVAAFAAAKGLA